MQRTSAEGYSRLKSEFSRNQREFPKGYQIYNPGEKANRIYRIQQGSVRLGHNTDSPLVTRDGVIGQETIARIVYQSPAITQQPSLLGSLDRRSFHNLVRNNFHVALALPDFLAGKNLRETEAVQVMPALDEIEFQILQCSANGLDRAGTTDKLQMNKRSVHYYSNTLIHKFEATSITQAVFTGYEMGAVDGNEAVTNVDVSKVQLLTPQELNLLQAFTNNGGESSSDQQLGIIFRMDQKAINTKMTRIRKELGAINRIQAGMMYLVARDRGMLDNIS